MTARHALLVGAVVAGTLAGCARRELTVIEATYGARCGAPPGNATAAVAATCDGTSSCGFLVDVSALGDPAPGCAKDFQVVWRCATEEMVRTAIVPQEAGHGSTATLECRGLASARIDVLAASAGAAPVGGLTAAVVERCAGRTACSVALGDLAPLRDAPTGTATVRVHWRCEGEMTKRESTVSATSPARLSCE